MIPFIGKPRGKIRGRAEMDVEIREVPPGGEIEFPWYTRPGLKRGTALVLIGIGQVIPEGYGMIIQGIGYLLGAIGLIDPIIKESKKVGEKGEGIVDLLIKLIKAILELLKKGK